MVKKIKDKIDFKKIRFRLLSVAAIIWWFFILFTLIIYVIYGCWGGHCTLQKFTEKILINIYLSALLLSIPSGFFFYKKYLYRRPTLSKAIVIISVLLLFYVLFFQ